MEIKFKKNNKVKYMQDHFFKSGIPNGIDFNVKILSQTRIRLSANGYGELSPGKYGNGALFVLVEHLPKLLKNKVMLYEGKNEKGI